jgi:uroporphyrinogen decarboxylase
MARADKKRERVLKAQVKAADGVLSGLYIWGDVAYTKGMLFSPKTWEKLYYPYVKRMCEEFHKIGMKVIYRGCGDSRAIMDMLIDTGIDGYNPPEAKAGLDAVELVKKFGRYPLNLGEFEEKV